MAELATIARPYAEALFKASSADLAGAAAWLDELAAIAGNPQLLQFADSPKTSVDQVVAGQRPELPAHGHRKWSSRGAA